MVILSIETSCDETSIALLEHALCEGLNSFRVLSHVTLSQIDIHRQYGGVYPNAARREHQLNIVPVLHETLEKAGILRETAGKDPLSSTGEGQGEVDEQSHFQTFEEQQNKAEKTIEILSREAELLPILQEFLSTYEKPKINCISVTSGPGLEPALWVGVNFARALAAAWELPLVAVNHMEGHVFSVFAGQEVFAIPELSFPAIALLISGGHTELVHMSGWNSYERIGATVDDAIGEAFDKVARLLGLPYPGGPEISRLASQFESEHASHTNESLSEVAKSLLGKSLPRPMIHSGDLNFSFSGIKTAVRYLVDSLPKPLTPALIQAIAWEFEMAVTEVILAKSKRALIDTHAQTLIIGGGVAANSRIRNSLRELCENEDIAFYTPHGVLAMDNALMIGVVGALRFTAGHISNPDEVRANGNWSL